MRRSPNQLCFRASIARHFSNVNHHRPLRTLNARNLSFSVPATSSHGLRNNSKRLNVVACITGIFLGAYTLQNYWYGSNLRSDVPSEVEEERLRRDSRQLRRILHGSKLDTQYGVDVEHILKRCEDSVENSGPGVRRYDINQIASNSPTEDDHSEAVVRSPSGSSWHFWTVIDGHVGWETSAALSERLIPSVNGALRGLYNRNANPTSSDIDSAITQAFLNLDDEFVNKSLEKALNTKSRGEASHILSQALAGAVALLAFYDPSAGQVKVALTGDLRAVRGRKGADGKWETTVLTIEQDGANEDEAARIRKEHPGEPDVIKDGRVLGWQPTRMFGDAGLKWSVENQKEVRKRFLGGRVRDVVKTPPYVTAEPVITTTDVKPGDFLILGCDGIWESLSSEEAVSLVGLWLESSTSKAKRLSSVPPLAAKGPKSSRFGGWFGKSTSQSAGDASHSKEKTVRYEQWRIPKTFVTVDENVATHLIRNSLGGEDTETMRALLTRTGSLARRLRDDMTVTVVFFDDSI